jgi:uncharacterized SAM-binding protein YcdF (DUF218 family)
MINRKIRILLWAAPLLLLFSVFALLHWGGYLLIAPDQVPNKVEAAVVLQGSFLGESVRIPEGIRLLQEGTADRVLLSMDNGTIWGEPLPPMARRFLQSRFGARVSDRVEFCETGPEVNSTGDEARALVKCIQDRGWQRVLVVTSNYHTRRAGITWRKVLHQQNASLEISMHGVEDPEYSPQRWWRERTYAKTWLLEMTKLLWTVFVPGGS